MVETGFTATLMHTKRSEFPFATPIEMKMDLVSEITAVTDATQCPPFRKMHQTISTKNSQPQTCIVALCFQEASFISMHFKCVVVLQIENAMNKHMSGTTLGVDLAFVPGIHATWCH
jgi:hypothetical protein